jgi:hypothetical protein
MAELLLSPSLLDDLAEDVLNPRPSAKPFANLDERMAEHDRLLEKGTAANAAGEWEEAQQAFDAAYPILLKSSTLLSALGIRLKRGEAELAAACYEKLLQSDGALLPAERALAERKLVQASALARQVRAIIKAVDAAHGGSEEQHDKLAERGASAARDGRFGEAYALYHSAWAVLHRPFTLISAAEMQLRDGREELACALLFTVERFPSLTDEEEEAVERLLAEARQALVRKQTEAVAARSVQAAVRGRNARRELGASANGGLHAESARDDSPAHEVGATNGFAPAAQQNYNERLNRARMAKGGAQAPGVYAARLSSSDDDDPMLSMDRRTSPDPRHASVAYASDDDRMLRPDYRASAQGAGAYVSDDDPWLSPAYRAPAGTVEIADSDEDPMLSPDYHGPAGGEVSDSEDDPMLSTDLPSTVAGGHNDNKSPGPHATPGSRTTALPPRQLNSSLQAVDASRDSLPEMLPQSISSPRASNRPTNCKAGAGAASATVDPARARVGSAGAAGGEAQFLSGSARGADGGGGAGLSRGDTPTEEGKEGKEEEEVEEDARFVSEMSDDLDSDSDLWADMPPPRVARVASEMENAPPPAAPARAGWGMNSPGAGPSSAAGALLEPQKGRAAVTASRPQQQQQQQQQAQSGHMGRVAGRPVQQQQPAPSARLGRVAGGVPESEWARFLRGGGDPETSRKGWLAHYIGKRKHKEAMALVVTAEEAAKVAAAFQAADTDGDGKLSEAELAAFASLADWVDDAPKAARKTAGAAARKAGRAAAALGPAAAALGPAAAQAGVAAVKATADMMVPDSVRWNRWLTAGGDAEAARRGWLRHHIGWRRYHQAMALVVSAEEAADVAQAFEAADTDGDGVLSEAELAAFASLSEWARDPVAAVNKTAETVKLKATAAAASAAAASARAGAAVAKEAGHATAAAASQAASRSRSLAKRLAAAGTAAGAITAIQTSLDLPGARKRAVFDTAMAHYDWHRAADIASGGVGSFFEVACGIARVDWMARHAEAGDAAAALEMAVSAIEANAVRAHKPGLAWDGGGSIDARRRLGFTVALREHDWAEACKLAATDGERRRLRAEEERVEWLVYEGLRARLTGSLSPALELAVSRDEEAAVRALAAGEPWTDPAHAVKAWRECNGGGLWRGSAAEARLLSRARAAFAEAAATSGSFDSHLAAALTLRVNPMSLAVRDDVLVSEEDRWKQWLAGGGDAEAARRGWLRHHIGWRRYHQAMALVVNDKEAAQVAEAFKAADTDGDGKLSTSELESFASLVDWVDDPRYAAAKTAAAASCAVSIGASVASAAASSAARLLDPTVGWDAFIAAGGDAEASRRGWLTHYVARRRYDDAMALAVTETEAAEVTYACRAADTNNDGFLSRAEMDNFTRRIDEEEEAAAAAARCLGVQEEAGGGETERAAALARRRRLLAFTRRRASRKLAAVALAWLERRRLRQRALLAADAGAAQARERVQQARGREDAVAVLRRTAAAGAAADAADAADAVAAEQLQRVRIARRAAAEQRAELDEVSVARGAAEEAAGFAETASPGTPAARQARELAALALMREDDARAAWEEAEAVVRRVEAEAGEAPGRGTSTGTDSDDPFGDSFDRESVDDEKDAAARDFTADFEDEYERREALLRRKYLAADRLTHACRGRIARRIVAEKRQQRDLAVSAAARAAATTAADEAAAAAAEARAFEAVQSAEAAEAEAAEAEALEAAEAATMLQRVVRGTNARGEAARRRASKARAEADTMLGVAQQRADEAAASAGAAAAAEAQAHAAEGALDAANAERLRVEEERILAEAAAAMQALVRGHAARLRAAAAAATRASVADAGAGAKAKAVAREAAARHREDEAQRVGAATALQAGVRGCAARVATRHARMEGAADVNGPMGVNGGVHDAAELDADAAEHAALLIQRSWRGHAGRMRLWRDLVSTGQQRKVARRGGLFGIGKGKEQNRGLQLEADCLLYVHKAGRKPKRILFTSIAAVEPLPDATRWRLRMRKGDNYEFNAGSAVGRSAWVHCVSHNMRKAFAKTWDPTLNLLTASGRLSSTRRSSSAASSTTPRSTPSNTPRAAPTKQGSNVSSQSGAGSPPKGRRGSSLKP